MITKPLTTRHCWRDGASDTLDIVEPTQRPAGYEGTGVEQVEPTNHRPCQTRARCSGDRRSTTGSHGDTDRRSPTTALTNHPRSTATYTAWRVKDSNLGRHQPTDLQVDLSGSHRATNAGRAHRQHAADRQIQGHQARSPVMSVVTEASANCSCTRQTALSRRLPIILARETRVPCQNSLYMR
jgi:hypothetical protein